MPQPKKHFRRSKDQIKRDRALIANWAAQQYNSDEMAQLLFQECGYKISSRQIRTDLRVVRKNWLEKQHDNYQLLINEELARCDALEREAWEAWRESRDGDEEILVIEDLAKAVEISVRKGEDFERFNQRIKRTIKPKAPAVAFLQMIHAVQQDRRKLLGLYAPGQLGVNINTRSEYHIIKSYKNVSPDDWDEPEMDQDGVIEGELLPSGDEH